MTVNVIVFQVILDMMQGAYKVKVKDCVDISKTVVHLQCTYNLTERAASQRDPFFLLTFILPINNRSIPYKLP